MQNELTTYVGGRKPRQPWRRKSLGKQWAETEGRGQIWSICVAIESEQLNNQPTENRNAHNSEHKIAEKNISGEQSWSTN